MAGKKPTETELLKDGTMTIQQAAEFTGYSRDSIEAMIKAGELPWTQLRRRGGRKVIPKSALMGLLSENMVNASSAS